MPWTITGGPFGAATEFAEAGIMDCGRNLQTGGGDTCHFTLDLPMDDTPGFTVGGLVTIKNPAGQVWFYGPVSKVAPAATGSSETHQVELRSPWWFLERLTYLQYYMAYDYTEAGATPEDPPIVHWIAKPKSKVILGIDDDGERMTTGETIRAILDFANLSISPDITLGTIMDGITFPLIEMTDSTCAECIQQLLRFHPDAVLFCNQDNGSGAVNVILRADLPTLALDCAVDMVEVDRFTRPDLVPPGVAIHYETTTAVDDDEYVNIETDEAPSPLAASAVGGIHFTISLQGSRTLTQKQKITVGAIPEVGDTDAASWTWIQKHWPGFKDALAVDYVVGVGSFAQTVVAPEGAAEDYPAEWPRELLDGTVPEWLEDPDDTGTAAAISGPVQVTIYLTYKGTDAEERKKFAPSGRRIFITEIMGTTLTSQVYKKVTGYTQPELAPSGLASAYYEALTTLQAEGTARLVQAECGITLVAGRLLTLTNGPAGAGQCIIQSVNQNISTGETSLAFGPFNDCMAPSDFIELQRALTRSLSLSYADPEERTDAKVGVEKTTLRGGQKHVRNNDVSPPPQFPPLFFLGSKISETEAKFVAGKVMSTKWDASDTDPKPEKAYEEINAATATLALTAGDKVWCKLTLTSKDYQPTGTLGGPYTSLTASFSGASIVASFSGSWSAAWSQTSGEWTNTANDLTGLTIIDEEGIPNITGTVTVVLSGQTDFTGSGTSGTSAHRHDLAPGVATATHSLTLNTADLGVSGTLVVSGSCTIEGEIGAVTMPTIVPFTPTGTVTVSPNTLQIPTEATLKVTVWECTTAEIVKEASPTSDETHAYVPLGEAVSDGAGGWIWEQHHAGLIFWNSPPAVIVVSDAGGAGP